MREDEDAERACAVDEAGRRNRLAGRRRVAEPVATDRAGILRGRELFLERLVDVVRTFCGCVVVVVLVDLRVDLLDGGVAVAVPVRLLLPLPWPRSAR